MVDLLAVPQIRARYSFSLRRSAGGSIDSRRGVHCIAISVFKIKITKRCFEILECRISCLVSKTVNCEM